MKKQTNVSEPENAGAVANPPEASGAAAPDAGEVQGPTAAAEAAAPAVNAEVSDQKSEVSPTLEATAVQEEPAPDRQLAAEMVTRFLGHQGSKARDEVSDLNDAEAWEVVRAGGDRLTARAQIKSVIGRAYDRRREAAQVAAGEQQAAAERARDQLAREMP